MSVRQFFRPPQTPLRGAVAVSRPKAFEAAHAYAGEAFGAARRVHGHNYVVTATISGPVNPVTDFLADFRDLDAVLSEVVQPLDHRRLDREYAPLAGREPCVEALAAALYGELAPRVTTAIPAARLAGLRVAETDTLWADADGGDLVELTRAYSFSAAHRLANPERSSEDNRRIYGKCANPEPHGHDYHFEVVVRGAPDPRTGLVADLAALDRAVGEEILTRFDHRYLNVEVEPFDRVVPTAERIAERLWALLARRVDGLARVVIYETPRSAFSYEGPEA